MGYGDEILAAGQAKRWFDVHGTQSIIVDVNGRPRRHDIWDGNPAILQHPDPGWSGEGYHTIRNGPHCRPYIVYPFTEDTGWTFNKSFHARDHRAYISLTRDEIYRGAAARRDHGRYILIDPWSKHPNLRWPLDYWKRLVRILSGSYSYAIVQHVYPGAPVLPGAIPIESPSFRVACGLVEFSSLYVRGESGMCHAAAALGRAQVTIWGGCMDWDVLGGYDKQLGLVEDHPCGTYRLCTHCQRVMANISVERVLHAIESQLECYAQEA